MSTTYTSAPNLRKWKMPCCAMMQPIRKVMRRMMGTACQPTRSRWCTADVIRNAEGRTSVRPSAVASAPSMVRGGMNSRPSATVERPIRSKAESSLLPLAGTRAEVRFAPCTSSSSSRQCPGTPSRRASRPTLCQVRIRRSISQAPNVSSATTRCMSRDTARAPAASRSMLSTTASSLCAWTAVHAPPAASSSRSPVMLRLSRGSFSNIASQEMASFNATSAPESTCGPAHAGSHRRTRTHAAACARSTP